MAKAFRVLFIVSLLASVSAFGQTADQEVVSAVDSPDPVTPGAPLTYTVTLTNHGPDPATGGGVNINLPLAVTHQSSSGPAGFTCNYLGNNGTCNMPSLPFGTYVITVNVVVNASLAAFPDQDISATFFPSGTTIDPNNGNNAKTATTTVNSSQVDLSVSATDSPDPVFPDGTVTYTVDVTNGGPDTASTVNFNVVPHFSLAFQSVTVPAGWSCTPPAVGSQNATFTCTRATWAPGTSQFTVVFSANDENFGLNDSNFTSVFGVNSGSNETDQLDNQQSVSTQYTTPDADMHIEATDSPDPVFPDGDITYTVTVTNQGPDAAPNARMTIVGNGGQTRFVSLTAPAGWSCSPPPPGTLINATNYDCTNPSLASGASAIFTVVTEASDDLHPNSDHNVTQAFATGSNIADPDGTDNSTTVTTAYVVNDADMNIAVTDSPDPVSPDGNITYTITVTNQGPDTATNARMTVAGNGGQTRFQSITAPAGWTCAAPAPNTLLNATSFDCTNPSLASGASAVFTMVATASDDLHPNSDHNITQAFLAAANEADPDNTDNSETETTAYVVNDADMNITVTDAPDPVSPDGNITYTITVTNQGPDTATNARMTVAGNGGQTRFQSITAPAGWTCAAPAPNTLLNATSFDCTNPSFASGASAAFTMVVTASDDLHPNSDHNITQAFLASANEADPDNTDNSETETTAYVVNDADMNITVTDAPDPVTPDGNITYTITVTNQGPDAATNARMTVAGNGGQTRFQSITAPAGWTCAAPAPNTLINASSFDCTNSSFASGASAAFTMVVTASDDLHPNSDHNITQAFLASANEADPDNTDNSETETTLYDVSNADLSVTNADSPDPVTSGGTITYTQSIQNAGPDTATNVTFNQILEPSVGFQSIAPPAGWTCATPAVGASGAVNCSTASLASGANGNFTLVVTVLASSGTVTSSVTAGSSASDPDQADNTATVTTTILAPVIADLAITKTTASSNAAPGATVTYTISLTNNGPDAAANVVVTDVLPASLLFQSISEPAGFDCTTPAVGANGTITCTAATMASATTATFTLVAQVAGNASGTIDNTATVTSDTSDNNGGNNAGNAPPVTVGGAGTADLGVTKSTTTTTASAGDTVTYTIAVTNNGPDAANGVVMTDTLPPSLLFQSILSASPAFTCATPPAGASGTITCTGGPLSNGATATFTLTTTIAPGATGSIANSVSVSSNNADSNGGNSSATTPGIIVGEADLAITKTTNATQAQTGSTINYTIAVTNNGPDAATNVIVNDDLPAGLQFVSATPSQGSCSGTDPFSCNLGTLASGASATIALQVLVTATSGTITNTATVDSDVDDDNLGNNTGSSAPTPVAPAAGEATGIPTLSEWALMALVAMLAMAAVMKMR